MLISLTLLPKLPISVQSYLESKPASSRQFSSGSGTSSFGIDSELEQPILLYYYFLNFSKIVLQLAVY